MAYFRAETDRQPKLLFRGLDLVKPKRLVLRGRVVTMNQKGDVIDDGVVCIEDTKIVNVSPWTGAPPEPFKGEAFVDTNGSIYPGLIELHNHPAYNMIPMWSVPERYGNRYVWRDNADYKRKVSRPGKLLTYHPNALYPKALVRYVECKALLGGVTTTQGFEYKNGANQNGYFEGLVRNVEFPHKDWPIAVDQLEDFKTKREAYDRMKDILGTGQRVLMHMSEGTDATSLGFFGNLQQDDGTWLIGPELVGIHAVALKDAQLEALASGHCGGIVWSPLSNYLLYGQTTLVDRAAALGIPIALGSDWAPSGTKNLLGELKIARLVSRQAGGVMSDRDLVRAVTAVPAKLLGWESLVGTVEEKRTADLLVIDTTQQDPYANLIEATESNIIAVLIDGRPRAGRAEVIDPRPSDVELITVAKQNMVLDIVESPGHPLACTTLGAAVAIMRDALARLPEIAQEAQNQTLFLEGAVDQWRPVADYGDPDEDMSLFAAPPLPKPEEVDPLEIEPITQVDDADFVPRIRRNINVPQWLKDALP